MTQCRAAHIPTELTRSGKPQRNGRIKMRSGIGPGYEHTAHNGKTPGKRHHHPSGTLALGLAQRHTRHYAATQ